MNEKLPDWNDLFRQQGSQAVLDAIDRAEIWQPRELASKGDAASGFGPGDWVSPPDRDNWGRITRVQGDSATVHFVSPSGQSATKVFPLSELRKFGQIDLAAAAAIDFQLQGSADFAAADYRCRFDVKRILAAKQPCIIAGPPKSLKTSIVIDLILSLGSATPFLGQFEVPSICRAAFFSGESGKYSIQRIARAVCASRGIELSETGTFWTDRLPQVGDAGHLAALKQTIVDKKLGAVGIDPAFLCLLGGAPMINTANVFQMGSLLLGLTEIGQETGCTILLIHHVRKNRGQDVGRYDPIELEEIAYAGFSEWARQWLLIGRRSQYEIGSGTHELWLTVGGSAGHNGLYSLIIDEGQFEENGDRCWRVTVASASEAKAAAREAKETAKVEAREAQLLARCKKVLKALRRHPNGETANVLKTQSGINTANFQEAIDRLIEDGAAVEVEVFKRNQKTPYVGYKLTVKGRLSDNSGTARTTPCPRGADNLSDKGAYIEPPCPEGPSAGPGNDLATCPSPRGQDADLVEAGTPGNQGDWAEP